MAGGAGPPGALLKLLTHLMIRLDMTPSCLSLNTTERLGMQTTVGLKQLFKNLKERAYRWVNEF